jgi:hypothetical protein
MDPSDIRDEASLKAWLKTQTREVALTIAHRAAMRVAPVYWRNCPPAEQGFGLEPMQLFQSLITSSLAVGRDSERARGLAWAIISDPDLTYSIPEPYPPRAALLSAFHCCHAASETNAISLALSSTMASIIAAQDIPLGIGNVANINAWGNIHDNGDIFPRCTVW